MPDLSPHHSGISVGDLDASIAWYRDMLGFSLGTKHIAYAVPDVEALMDELKEKGADVVWDARVHDGETCAFLRDNTGNLVEFVQRP